MNHCLSAQKEAACVGKEFLKVLIPNTHHVPITNVQLNRDIVTQLVGRKGKYSAHQLSLDDAHENGEVVVHNLLALASQALIRDQLTGLLHVSKEFALD